jgi:DtxR family transcriptional regulator, Mn-dependent transcriptional regulator
MITPQMEEYLEAIGKLQERDEPITTSALAKQCRVAPPTVTEMLHHLLEHGYIRYEPRREIELTPEGQALANTMIRRHRLWERFLQDVLGLRWDQVHEQACQLEHATSPDLERRLAQAAGDPATCPHGHIIPGSGDQASSVSILPLTNLPLVQTARVVMVQEDAGLLRRLSALGIVPGVVLQVVAAAQDGALSLLVAGSLCHLAQVDACQVDVALLSPAEVIAEAHPEPTIALGALAQGESATVHGFLAGRGMVARCLALGLTPGTTVKMIQNLRNGPVIALVRDTRVALGNHEAQRIMVRRDTLPEARSTQSATLAATNG